MLLRDRNYGILSNVAEKETSFHIWIWIMSYNVTFESITACDGFIASLHDQQGIFLLVLKVQAYLIICVTVYLVMNDYVKVNI